MRNIRVKIENIQWISDKITNEPVKVFYLLCFVVYFQILDFIDLPLSRETGISIPFVKVYLYPQNVHSYPEVSKGSGFRVEVLSFPRDTSCTFTGCPIDKLCSSAMKFVILDYDRFSRSEYVADCVVMMDEVSLEGEAISKHLSIRKTQTVSPVHCLCA